MAVPQQRGTCQLHGGGLPSKGVRTLPDIFPRALVRDHYIAALGGIGIVDISISADGPNSQANRGHARFLCRPCPHFLLGDGYDGGKSVSSEGWALFRGYHFTA